MAVLDRLSGLKTVLYSRSPRASRGLKQCGDLQEGLADAVADSAAKRVPGRQFAVTIFSECSLDSAVDSVYPKTLAFARKTAVILVVAGAAAD